MLSYVWALAAKLRILGWEWFEKAGMIQSKLLGRSLQTCGALMVLIWPNLFGLFSQRGLKSLCSNYSHAWSS